MTIFRDFQGPRPRRDIGMARPRHSKTRLETSSSAFLRETNGHAFANEIIVLTHAGRVN